MADEKGIPERRIAFLETCFDTFCKNGLENTSLQMLAEACGVTNGALLYYFETKDNIVIESTAHCMAKVEDDFMARAPRSFEDIERFLREMPYITAQLHGEKYRFMYQVYLLFFKAGQADAITAAFQKYSEKVLHKGKERPSILGQLRKFTELIKTKPKEKQHTREAVKDGR